MLKIRLTCWCISSTITRTSIPSYQREHSPRLQQKLEMQRSILETLHKLEPFLRGSQQWKTLTDAVCYCIAKDALSLDSVNDPGFRFTCMLRTFEPRYMLPDTCRKTLSTHYMVQLYEHEKSKIVDQIGTGMNHFAITTDAWSSRAGHSYITCTVHYITPS